MASRETHRRSRTKRPRARPYHHGHLREALLDAALRRLEDGGASRLSLRALARDAGVTVNATYRHFADKDALLDAVATEGFRRLAEAQRAAAESAAPDERMSALGEAYVDFARSHVALFRLMFGRTAAADGDAALGEAAAAAFQPLRDAMATCLSLPVADQRTTVAALAAWALVHGLSHLLLDRQMNRFVVDPDAFAAMALRALRFDTTGAGSAPR